MKKVAGVTQMAEVTEGGNRSGWFGRAKSIHLGKPVKIGKL